MTQFSQAVIKEKSRLTFKARRENDQLVQDLLYAASYHALRGNSDPLNFILADAVESGTTKLQGLLRWVRENLPVGMKDDKFKLNKTWVEAEVKSEEEFERKALIDLKQAPKWWELQPKSQPQKEWDASSYLDRVVDMLKKHGQDAAANEVLAAKAKLKAA